MKHIDEDINKILDIVSNCCCFDEINIIEAEKLLRKIYIKLLFSKEDYFLANDALCVMSKDNNYLDKDVFEHSIKVSYYMKRICGYLFFDRSEIETMMVLALLHDIGKILIEKEIFIKPKLNETEWNTMKKHPSFGYSLLIDTKYSELCKYIISHHERWDGKGYPYGLKGEEIFLPSRILAVADAYDAMISDRCYRPAFFKAYAIEQLLDNAGTQFDSEIVNIFIKLLKKEKYKVYKKTFA